MGRAEPPHHRRPAGVHPERPAVPAAVPPRQHGDAAAWDVVTGDAAIAIAITDDGVDVGHEDIEGGLWTNAFEVPGDGIDNDFNGYVDDVHGVDLYGGDGDPSPSGGDSHGTHCAGIAAAPLDNGIGIAGTAGGASIMPVRFYESGGDWTAVLVADAFAYATDNGARIISTSYNMDGWVGDPIVHAAFDYLYDEGVLHFNSAGNGGALNPPRQAFVQSFLVASTDAADEKAGSSNYGTGVDLAAPGASILSTIVNDGYEYFSGTSMASPNAAGVAALVWSAFPSWTRDQVAAQVFGTADDVDAENPAFVGLLGGGRVNARRAVTESLPVPTIDAITGLPGEGETVLAGFGPLNIRWAQVMAPNSVNRIDAMRLVWAGPDGAFQTPDDVDVPLDRPEYLLSSNETPVAVDGDLPGPGVYRFIVRGGIIRNPFGQALDADGDGSPGGDFVRTFDACAGLEISVDDLESGAGWQVVNGAIEDGAWDANPSVPVGGGDREDPATDFDGSGRCFLTDNVDDNSDVDGGPTDLLSAPIDLTGADDPLVSYARWLGNDDGDDQLEVFVSNDDGASWTLVETVGDEGVWRQHVFRVADLVAPTASVRLRFRVSDTPNDSVTEAGIDTIRVLELDCGGDAGVPGDVDGDGAVGLSDLLEVLAGWGPCAGCSADLDGDGVVGLDDLLILLAAWS